MATPWGVEFKEDVVFVVDYNILVVVGDDDLDGSGLFLGDRLGFDAGVDLAVDEVLDEGADLVVRDFFGLAKGVFGVFDGVLDGEGGPFALFKVQISGVGAERFGVNGREVDDTLVLLGDWLQGLCEFCALLRGFGENIGEGDLGLWWNAVRTHLTFGEYRE